MNLNDIFSMMKNPAQYLPADYLKNPQAAVQNLMNSGRMSQQQFNYFRQLSDQILKSPMFGKR